MKPQLDHEREIVNFGEAIRSERFNKRKRTDSCSGSLPSSLKRSKLVPVTLDNCHTGVVLTSDPDQESSKLKTKHFPIFNFKRVSNHEQVKLKPKNVAGGKRKVAKSNGKENHCSILEYFKPVPTTAADNRFYPPD